MSQKSTRENFQDLSPEKYPRSYTKEYEARLIDAGRAARHDYSYGPVGDGALRYRKMQEREDANLQAGEAEVMRRGRMKDKTRVPKKRTSKRKGSKRR